MKAKSTRRARYRDSATEEILKVLRRHTIIWIDPEDEPGSFMETLADIIAEMYGGDYVPNTRRVANAAAVLYYAGKVAKHKRGNYYLGLELVDPEEMRPHSPTLLSEIAELYRLGADRMIHHKQ